MKCKICLVMMLVLVLVVALCSCNQETSSGQTQQHVHTYGEWKTIQAACLKDGKQERTCSCGAKESKVVAKRGHIAKDGKCSECGLDFFDELVTLLARYDNKYSDSPFEITYNPSGEWIRLIYSYRVGNKAYLFPDGLWVTIDRESVQNGTYFWSFNDDGYFLEGTLVARDFTGKTRLTYDHWTHPNQGAANSSSSSATMFAESLWGTEFAEFLKQSSNGLTVANFGFKNLS